MANFPTSLDTGSSLPNPTGTNTQNNPDHAALHSSENAAIIAAETKIGIGASAPASNTLLVGTGAGTSAWQGLTSAQLAAVLSDETGSGAAVFGTSPTLITPKVDTINENTPGNGVTVGGVNLKSGVVTGSLGSANAVATTNITDNNVTASKLATNAITLGYAQITANISTSSTSVVAATGLSVTVTIPSGGRKTKITAYIPTYANSAASNNFLSIWDGTVGSGTQLQLTESSIYTVNANVSGICIAVATPVAGSKTYNVGYYTTNNTATIVASSTAPAFVLVEEI